MFTAQRRSQLPAGRAALPPTALLADEATGLTPSTLGPLPLTQAHRWSDVRVESPHEPSARQSRRPRRVVVCLLLACHTAP